LPDREETQDQSQPSPPRPPAGTDQDARLEIQLKRVTLGREEAQRRDQNATAEIKEQEAAKLKAEAAEAHHRAAREPSRQTQALAAGWTRIVLTILVTVFAMVMLVVGYLVDPVAYAPAALAGFGLYPLRPWEFVFPATKSDRTGPGDPGD
jgi:Flp pilus assembly protein TadB